MLRPMGERFGHLAAVPRSGFCSENGTPNLPASSSLSIDMDVVELCPAQHRRAEQEKGAIKSQNHLIPLLALI